jgi:carbon storage regulator
MLRSLRLRRLPRKGYLVLVLTRRANQSIMIGHEIVVTVLEVRGDQVRLGIKAPRSIDVHREEIFAQLQQANRDAAQAPKQPPESLEGLAQPAGSDAAADAEARAPHSNG